MKFTSRVGWKAVAPTKTSPMTSVQLGWIIHYNGPALPPQLSGAQAMQSIQRYHMVTKGWRDIAYSFGIGQDGFVYEGRGWNILGGHTSGRFKGTGPSTNANAHGVIFLIGEGQIPSNAALDAFSDLVDQGRRRGIPARFTPHFEASPLLGTSCPGPLLTSITRQGYFANLERHPMNETAIVKSAYTEILGREADPSGLDYWVKRLVSREVGVEDMRWHFFTVRIAAIEAMVTNFMRASTGPGGGADPVVAADQAYNRFLADLVALAAAGK